MSSDDLTECEQFALNILSGITNRIYELKMFDHLDLCYSALKLNHNYNMIIENNNSKLQLSSNQIKNDKIDNKIDRKLPISENFIRNQYLRFNIGDGIHNYPVNPRASWSFFGSSNNTNNNLNDKEGDIRNYDEVIAIDILNASICDICVVQSKTEIPVGYYRIYKTIDNKRADINIGTNGHPLYLCIKKDITNNNNNTQQSIITNFIIIFPDRNEYIPAGYNVVSKASSTLPYDLNSGNSFERIYLCYRKELKGHGNPITDIQIIFPIKGKREREIGVVSEREKE